MVAVDYTMLPTLASTIILVPLRRAALSPFLDLQLEYLEDANDLPERNTNGKTENGKTLD
jgi:hypothetical protein